MSIKSGELKAKDVLINFNSISCRKLKKGRNRIHSQAHSTTTLVTAEKKLGKGNAVGPAGPNMTIGNPISNLHSGSISSLSNGTMGMMERDAQRERDNYTATVRSKEKGYIDDKAMR